MSKSILLIFNAKSGRFVKKKKVKKYLEKVFEQEDILPFWINPLEVKDWQSLFKKNLFEEIWICGGDGTLFYLLPYICDNPYRIVLIPSGSGNGLTNALGISNNIKKSYLKHKEVFSSSIQVVKNDLQNVFSSVSVGFGLDASICEQFNKSSHRGLWTYIIQTLKTTLKKQVWHFTILNEKKEVFNDMAMLVVIANSCYYGNYFIVAPEANIFDKHFQLLVFPKMPIWRLVFIFFIFQCRVKKISKLVCKICGVKTWLTQSVIIQNNDLAPTQMDGENIKSFVKNVFKAKTTKCTIAGVKPKNKNVSLKTL